MMIELRQHQVQAEASLATAVRGIINLPTGTGKSLIQSRAIVNAIKSDNTPKVYVILSPRILLSNQLMDEVRKDLKENSTQAQYLVVHSGRHSVDFEELESEKAMGLAYRDMLTGTTHATICEAFHKSQSDNVPLVVSSTYHSAERLVTAGLPVEIVFCDEAHYLVQEQFSWIVAEPFYRRIYHFTATLRETPSKRGMGMNNTELFGEILYQEMPLEMIVKGEMVRPRMHIVDMSHDPDKDEADGLAVAEAFLQHTYEMNVGGKMLVVSKDGSTHLNNLASHNELMRLVEVRPNLRIFDISSEHKARINGVVVSRQDFLKGLRGLTDADEAIIIHHDILAEGIDVPGITGVMPLISLRKAKFLQTLGRATRLHKIDRQKLYSGELLPDQLNRFIKPHAWFIIPVYGEIGEDLHEDMKQMVRELRDHGFNPAEDIMIRQKRGKQKLVPVATVNDVSDALRSVIDFSADVLHELEEEDKASEFNLDVIKFAEKTIDEQLSGLSLEW